VKEDEKGARTKSAKQAGKKLPCPATGYLWGGGAEDDNGRRLDRAAR
jgi:hypothetical protein